MRPRRRRERPRERHDVSQATARRAQSFPAQQLSHRARRRPRPLGLPLPQDRREFPRAPVGMRASQRQDRGARLRADRATGMHRRAGPLDEAHRTIGLVPPDPLVRGLPRDAVPPRELRHRPLIAQPIRQQRYPLIHRTGLLPGHPSSDAHQTCYRCVRSTLLPLYPVWTISGAFPPRPPSRPHTRLCDFKSSRVTLNAETK
jgi:hypothetical protein